MQNPTQRFRQLFSRNQPFCLKKWTLWPALATVEFNNFRRNFVILLPNVYKRVLGIFSILFRSWVICQNKKRPGFYTPQKPGLLTTQDLNKIKKNPEHPFVDFGK